MVLGSIFIGFVALETGLKTDRFSGLPGGTPEFRQCTSRVPKSLFPGALENQKAGKTVAEGNASQPGGPKGPADIIFG